jgi:hypothetical protein
LFGFFVVTGGCVDFLTGFVEEAVGDRRVLDLIVVWTFCMSVRLGVAADRSVRTPASASGPSAMQRVAQPEE